MKRIILITVVLMLAAPAIADVNVFCVNDVNLVTVYWDATGEDPNLVRAFALDIKVSDGNIVEVNDQINPDYWVFPGTVVIEGENVTEQGTAVGDDTQGPEGGTGPGIDSNWVTIEMASLYAASDACNPTPPPNEGTLITFYVDSSCTVTLEENTTRGGVVMEDPYDSPAVNLTGCTVTIAPEGWPYPDCWDWKWQCYGDANNNDANVKLADFFDFKDAYGKNYWDHYPANPIDPQKDEYNPCCDLNADGFVALADFFVFKDGFKRPGGYVGDLPDCTGNIGDPCEVYKAGSVKP